MGSGYFVNIQPQISRCLSSTHISYSNSSILYSSSDKVISQNHSVVSSSTTSLPCAPSSSPSLSLLHIKSQPHQTRRLHQSSYMSPQQIIIEDQCSQRNEPVIHSLCLTNAPCAVLPLRIEAKYSVRSEEKRERLPPKRQCLPNSKVD